MQQGLPYFDLQLGSVENSMSFYIRTIRDGFNLSQSYYKPISLCSRFLICHTTYQKTGALRDCFLIRLNLSNVNFPFLCRIISTKCHNKIQVDTMFQVIFSLIVTFINGYVLLARKSKNSNGKYGFLTFNSLILIH